MGHESQKKDQCGDGRGTDRTAVKLQGERRYEEGKFGDASDEGSGAIGISAQRPTFVSMGF